MTKILITEPAYFPEEGLKDLKKLGEIVSKNVNYDQLLNEVSEYDILLIRAGTKIDKNILNAAKNLKIIGSPTTGIDHIDVKEVNRRGIKIFNSPGINTNAVAEHTFAIILSLARKIPSAMNKKFEERHNFIGFELKGKTLGIIGFGRIGKRIAEIANAFSMKILAYDPYVSSEEAKKFNAEMSDLKTLVREADVVSVNALLTEETRGMINKELIGMMKMNSILINTSREQLIDANCLIEALENKKIAGAALDVYEENPKLLEYARKNQNLILTPHIAGSTLESIHEATKNVIKMIKKELSAYGN